jgi:hypothetical protein
LALRIESADNLNFIDLRKGQNMLGKKSIFALLMAVGLGAASHAFADTITVTDNPNDVFGDSVSTVASGPYKGDLAYSYSVDFDPTTKLFSGSGDGFMVIDFGPLDDQSSANPGYSLVSPDPSVLPSSDLTESTQVAGAGLNGYTGNSGGSDHFLDASNSKNTANPTDNPGIDNAVFTYNGSSNYIADSDVDMTLTLYTTSTSAPELGNSFGVDNSGAASGLSFELKSVAVPSAPVGVPLPTDVACGSLLFGLVGAARMYRANRVERA